MRISRAFIILFLITTACKKGEKQAQVGRDKTCELHHKPFKSVSGYAAGPGILVDPGYGVTEFNTQFGDRYPHINRVALRSRLGEGWTEEMTVQVCEQCEENYSRDFAIYIKTDEKVRHDQFMEFLVKNRPGSDYGNHSDSDDGSLIISEDLPDLLSLPK